MTDGTISTSQEAVDLSAADEQLLRERRAGTRRRAEPAGEGGLLGNVTKTVIEGALEGEPPQREFPERAPCQDGAHRYRPVEMSVPGTTRRHLNRVEVRGLRRLAVAAAGEAEGSLTQGRWGGWEQTCRVRPS